MVTLKQQRKKSINVQFINCLNIALSITSFSRTRQRQAEVISFIGSHVANCMLYS